MKAKTFLIRAVELKPDFVEAQNNLGVVYLQLDDKVSAAEHFRKALSITPDYETAKANLAALDLEKSADSDEPHPVSQTLREAPAAGEQH